MEDRWIHQEAGTGSQRSGSGPGNELNPKGSYRADKEGPFQSLSAMDGGRQKRNSLTQKNRSNARCGGERAAATAGGSAAKPTPRKLRPIEAGSLSTATRPSLATTARTKLVFSLLKQNMYCGHSNPASTPDSTVP